MKETRSAVCFKSDNIGARESNVPIVVVGLRVKF
jgi:hypothetical protein